MLHAAEDTHDVTPFSVAFFGIHYNCLGEMQKKGER
jgi:hypothetical protein